MRKLVSVTALALVVSACGGPRDQTAATAELAKAGDQLAKDIASGKAASGPVVAFDKLIPFLPEVPGWTKHEPKGGTITMGLTMSNAKGAYEMGDSELEIEIGDSSMSSAFLAPYAAILRGNFSETTSEGYTKATKVSGYPASEEWQHETKWGEFKIIVGERFLVTVRGNAVADVETVRKAAEAMDLKGLAALR